MNITRLFQWLRPINPFRILREKTAPGLARWIPAKAEWMIGATLLFAVPFLWKSTPLAMARDMLSAYDLKNDPDSQFFASFKKIFPNEFFIIAFEREDLFSPASLAVVKDLTSALEGMEEVRRVLSLANAQVTEGRGEDFIVQSLLEDTLPSPAQQEALRQRAGSHPLFSKNLISPDGKTTAILVFPHTPEKDVEFRFQLLEKVKSLLAPHEVEGFRFHLGGTTAINVALAEYNRLDMARFTVLMYVFLTATLWFVFRNVRLVALALLNIVLVMGSVRGFAGWLGLAMNNFSVVSLPLTMALALSDTIHVFTHLRREHLTDPADRRGALARVLRSILFPCFLTSLNTGLGFLSLTVNRVNGLREFGLLAAAGMGFEFIYTFFFTAPLLLMFDPKTIYREADAPRATPIAKALRWIDGFVHARPRAIVLGAGLLAVGALGLARGLKVDTNIYSFFRPQDPWRQSLDFIERRLAGIEGMDISLQTQEGGSFKDPRHLQVLEKIQRAADRVPSIDKSVSLVDYLAMINQSFHGEDPAHHRLPERRNLVEQYLLLYGAKDIEDFVNPEFTHARILLRSRAHSTSEQAPVLAELQRIVDATPHPGLTIRLTGQAVNDHHTSLAIVQDMSVSVFTSIGLIALVMLLSLESVPLTLLFLVPNLLPIVLNFGLMRVLGMTLSGANALIAASAFGMIVDDTVHFFTTFVALRKRGENISGSVKRLIAEKGEASFSSFFVLMMAFAVLLTSAFKPTFQFGLLNIVVLLTGIASDQILMNAIFIWIGRRGRARKGPDREDVISPAGAERFQEEVPAIS